ncbi:MAG TPA: CHRD domain-containing protein [Bacteroidia bacterium]|nr:CHRD domain-containing protein [Bacteroidia bacterium]
MRKTKSIVLSGAIAALLLSGCNQKQETAAPAATKEQSQGTATYTTQSAGANEADRGKEIGFVYEAYLSPHQEGGEEKDTPKSTPSQFKSTTPSRLRADRKDRGHGKVSFTKDLSKAIIEVEVTDVNIKDVNMFHIHCGRPSMLGPIGIDFSLTTDIQKNFNDDGVLALEVTNKEIEAVVASGEGLVGAITLGCPIFPGSKDKFTTIGGMQYLAEQGDLYFNLHTTGESYFGDIRGQLHRMEEDTDPIEWKVAPQDAPKPASGSEGGHMHH